jgi:osmotically inducible protein OsmC
MQPYSRQASVRWFGKAQRAKAAAYKPSTGLKMTPLDGDIKRRSVNPPELIAAAHAGSFALTLANVLAEAGYHPRQIDTTATVMMERAAKGWTLTQIHLDVTARVPKAAECDFVDAALQAKADCPISRALNANISMRAKLTRNAGET